MIGRITLSLCAASLCSSLVAAQSLNMDIGNGNAGPSVAYGGAAVSPGTWNAFSASVGSTTLFKLNGTAATGVAITGFPVPADFFFNNTLTLGDDDLLLDDLEDVGGVGGTTTWTITGLSNGIYDVYVYSWAPDDRINFITDVTVNGGSLGAQPCGGAGWTGVHVLGRQYVKDTTAVTSGSLSFIVTTTAGFGNFNGLQLVDVTPSLPVSYCTAGTTTNGCVATITATANPSAGFFTACVINTANVEGAKSGLIFYSISGQNNAPWNANSFLCVKSPTQRTGTQVSGGTDGLCDGALTLNWNGYQTANPTSLGNPFSPGNLVQVQTWFRDPPAGKTTNLSNAIEMTCQP